MGVIFDERTASVGTNDVTIAGPNLRRQAITISAPSAGVLFVTFGRPAAINGGFRITAGIAPVTFGLDQYGAALECDIHAIMSVGNESIEILDVFLG